MKKRIISIIFGLVCAFIYMSVIVNAGTTNEKSWYFKDNEFAGIANGIITETITVNGLTLSSGLQMNYSLGAVKAGASTTNFLYFDKSIYTTADGSTSSGYIKFSVSGDTDIHILGKSKSDKDDRSLSVYTTADKVTGSVMMSPNTDDYVYKYRGSASDVYLYTADGGVRIYGITAKNYSADEYAPLSEGEKVIWDFKDFTSYTGSISEDISFNGMEIKATAENPITIGTGSSNKEPYGYMKSRYVNFDGRIKTDSRYITFPVNRNSDVYITAMSSSSIEARNLFVWSKYYGTPDTDMGVEYFNVSSNIYTYKISYYGEGEDFMIGSEDSGIKIYKIAVVPRVNKVIEYKSWDISNNSSFAVGTYANSTIDGLNLIGATVENGTATNNQKAIHLLSGIYGTSHKIKFDISDSSATRGAAVKRTITIKAKSAYDNQMKLVLISSDDMIIGSTDLTTEIAEYKFDYTGSYDSIYVYSYYPVNGSSKGAYIYSIDNGVTGTIGPEDIERTISIVNGQSYRYFVTCNNIDDVSKVKYTIAYNSDALRIERIGENPVSQIYNRDGYYYLYYDSSMTNVLCEKGIISFEINNDNKDWSGILCPVEFKAKSTGNTTIQLMAEIQS